MTRKQKQQKQRVEGGSNSHSKEVLKIMQIIKKHPEAQNAVLEFLMPEATLTPGTAQARFGIQQMFEDMNPATLLDFGLSILPVILSFL